MDHRIATSKRLAGRALKTLLAAGVSPAFAATTMTTEPWATWLTTDEWSTYLLFGSIMLLVFGAVLKMLTYRGRPDTPPNSEVRPVRAPEEQYTIGSFRNQMLIPGP